MKPPYPDPLAPEERELATRLSRLGPHGEPPAALDARILSAAQAALAAAPAHRRRWPAVIGIAATLAVAVGISWQLRPRDEAATVLHEGPVPAREAPATSAPAPSQPVAAGAEHADVAQPVATEHAPPPRRATRASGEQRAAQQRAAKPIAPQRQPLTAAPAPPPPVPAAAPPPPPPPVPEAVAPPAPTPVVVAAPPAMEQRKATPAPVSADAMGEQATSAMQARPLADVPVEEDAQLDATDWLDRVRQRQAAGDITGARHSLALFRRYYPDRVLPEDLAPLAE